MHLNLLLPVGLLASITLALGAPQYCTLKPPKSRAASVQSSASSGSGSTYQEVVASGWYPGWLGEDNPPSSITWTSYTAMTFAFAVTTPDVNVVSLDDISTQVLPKFVSQAKSNNVKALLSVGGWTGSQYFSTAVATASNRTAFVQTILGLVSTYDLDGIDFDWEYPNKQGVGCNTISSDDSSNFLAFLQELREDPQGAKLNLTAAVGIVPFMGPDATPMTDVSDFATVLDHIAIMAYDIWGSWSATVGPNAPLNDSCAPVKAGSAVSAVEAWTAANFPAEKIVLGVASYGHSFHVDTSAALSSSGAVDLYPAFDGSQQPHGDKDDGNAGVDQCGNPVPIGGIFNFWGLVDGGFLNSDGTAASGIDYIFDNCSQTPFVYNATSEVMVSYDDATSFAAKGKFINEQGLAGFAMWNVAGDYNDVLLNAISDAMGIESVCPAS